MTIDLKALQELSCETDSHGVVTLRSVAMRGCGIVHGFSTRVGGVSEPPYDTLNLDQPAKGADSDPNTHVAENYRRFRAAIGAARKVRITVRQVHGACVWAPPDAPQRWRDAPEADAMVSTHPQHMLTIRVADCVPVLLATPDGCTVAAAHAGWRGIVAGVVGATVQRLIERSGVGPHDLLAAVGPCISVARYEVGPEVAAAFGEAGLSEAVDETRGDKPHVDPRGAVVRQLQHAGLAEAHLAVSRLCTYDAADRFYSYRRDGRHTGRMVGAICPREG